MTSKRLNKNDTIRMPNESQLLLKPKPTIDEPSCFDSIDDNSNSHIKKYDDEDDDDDDYNEIKKYTRTEQMKYKNPKSHRLIEKRRRDRMNRSLDILLDLIPHKRSQNQKRIEKTEIIEMAIKHIRHLITLKDKSSEFHSANEKCSFKLDAYRLGYHNATCDVYKQIEKVTHNDAILSDIMHYITEKETELKDLSVLPDKKSNLKIKITTNSKCNASTSDNNESEFNIALNGKVQSIDETNVPIFVLHPSGTHYLPMYINSSVISHAFNNNKSNSSSSTNGQLLCHPISIPVNFNTTSALSDPYELDIQNINVIGTRHQTSVRPN